MEPDGRVYGCAARTGAADRIRDRREDGPGLLSRFPGMAYQCRNDADWTMDLVSDGCRALTGFEPEALVNGEVTYGDIIHPEDRDRVWSEVQRAIDRGDPAFEFEYRIVRTDGKVREVWEQGHPVRSEAGELLGLEGFVTDITERRALEEQLRHAQRVEGLGELTGAIAHDFNNYLTAIIAPIEMVLETLPDGDESREDLVQARDAAKSAATLTGHLLSFSRRRVHSPRPVRLDDLMRALRYMLDRVTGERIRIEYRLDAGESVVMVDPSQLQQVVVNLVVNARDAMPDGGRVCISTRTEESGPVALGPAAPGPWVSLAVEDGGVGIDEATRARVFDPYFTTKPTGTGLGLSTAFGIVKQHGGELRVDSAPGGGATFTISFPVTDRTPDREVDGRSSATEPGRASASRPTILVVEDEEAVRRVVVAALERFGYTVVAAGSGERAVAVLRTHAGPIDLLLTDLTLPDLTGAELARDLRGERPELPVLIMSGYTPGDILQGDDGNPAFSFLEKPFMIDGLLSAVATALDRRNGRARQIGSG